MIIDAKIPKIQAKFSPSVYNQLINITDSINLQLDFANKIYLDKKEIVKNSKLITKLRKQGTEVQSWYQYFGILSGCYIYFFRNEKESIPTMHYYIKDCSINENPNVSNTFMLKNRFGECVLSFFKESECKK